MNTYSDKISDYPGVSERRAPFAAGKNKNEGKAIENREAPLRQRELCFSMCVAGRATACVNDAEHAIEVGTLWVKVPGTLACLRDMSWDYEVCEVVVPEEFARERMFDAKDIAADMALIARVPFVELDRGRQRDFMNWVSLSEGLHSSMGSYREKCLHNIFLSLIYFVCDAIDRSERVDSVNTLCASDRNYYYFVNFLELLGKECLNERSVRYYADRLCITPKYLSSVIKDVSGHTAGEWIDEFVMNEAKMMLQRTDYNISETAYKMNFPSISFFGKYFKRHTGMSPSDFKRQFSFA